MQELNLQVLDLAQSAIVEASAGTGKTWNLERIFIKLLLEKGPGGRPADITDILVVTFTIKATREISERIRKLLYTASADLSILDDFINPTTQVDDVPGRLREVLEDFDRASVFTIHAFCQKILAENPFESGGFFKLNYEFDRPLIERFCRDFFRVRADEGAGTVAALLQAVYGGMDECVDDIYHYYQKGFVRKTGVRYVPDPYDLKVFEQRLLAFTGDGRVRSNWDNWNEHGGARLEDLEWLRPDYLGNRITKAERTDPVGAPKIASGVTVFQTLLVEFFPELEEYKPTERNKALFTLAKLSLVYQALVWVIHQAADDKRKRGTFDFDDLIFNAHKAVENSGFRDNLRSVYRIALIDEFQDTDLYQWDIFRSLFVDNAEPGRAAFLIGDPKQSIYRFRNADLNVYFSARDGIGTRYTLPSNFRSTEGLIAAANEVFRRLFENQKYHTPQERSIDFYDVRYGGNNKGKAIVRKNGAQAPVEPPVSFLCADKTGKDRPYTTKDDLRNILAAKLIDIKENCLFEDGRPLNWSDFTFLTESNYASRDLAAFLDKLGIPAAIAREQYLFHQAETEDFLALLDALHEPFRTDKVKRALLSLFFNLSLGEIKHLEDEGGLTQVSLDFHRWHELCDAGDWSLAFFEIADYNAKLYEGPLSDWQSSEENHRPIEQRLLAFHGGARVLTNVMHLFETLQRVQRTSRLDTRELFAYLLQQKRVETPEEGSTESVRLDSETPMVRIMTIHASKGLEFPVVLYLPNMMAAQRQDKEFEFSEPDSEGGPNKSIHTVDLLVRPANKLKHEQALWQERLRWCYVLFTRAQSKMVMPFIDKQSFQAPVLDNFFVEMFRDELNALISNVDLWDEITHPVTAASGVTSAEKSLISNARRNLKRIVAGFCAGQNGLFAFEQIVPVEPARLAPPAIQPRDTVARTLPGDDLFTGRRRLLTSYSGLAKKMSVETEDFNILIRDREDSYSGPVLGGARFGDFCHDALEHLDYTVAGRCRSAAEFLENPAVAEVLTGVAVRYFSKQWLYDNAEEIGALLFNTLTAPFELSGSPFYPAMLDADSRRHEMEFTMVYDPAFSPAADGEPGYTDGFLKGYIDLVFVFENRYYLLDWKSNYLGPDVDGYNPQALQEAMGEHDYTLQADIYLAAFTGFLEKTVTNFDYESMFGGVIYLFLRGRNFGGPNGVYIHRPERAEADKIRAALSGTVTAEASSAG